MTSNDTYNAHDHTPSYSLTVLLLLADPVSTLLDRHRLEAIAEVALLGVQRATTRGDLVALHACAQELRWQRRKLKQAFTAAFAAGDIDASTTQRLIDRFEVWSD